MSKKESRTLLLGASFSAVPILNRLNQAGHRVTVVGAFPDDPCHKLSQNSILVDYSDELAIREIWERGDFDHLVPSCNDTSIRTATAVANEFSILGFDPKDSYNQIANKDEYRRLCQKLRLHTPRTIAEVASIDEAKAIEFNGRGVVKPVDSFSGIGISIAEGKASKSQILAAMAVSRSGKAVVEEFVEGGLHSHSAFIKGGQIVWQDFVDEFCEVSPYQVNRSSYPSVLTNTVKNNVSKDVQKIIDSLRLTDGLIHTQFIAESENFWLIESMRRCPGDLFGSHFSLSKGFDYSWNFVAPFIGEEFKLSENSVSKDVSRRVLTSSEMINFYGVAIPRSHLETIIIPLQSAGVEIDAAPLGKAGIIFQVNGNPSNEQNSTIIESSSF